ncbi:acyl-CoA dehydrogenase [Phreatobacter sp. AB_2022a]|uniref:acyl-CoA dehydrogenase n=1 Tax=Phreatobacter sp. AB_2022a TaxID=3003134 RepID=UPI0022870BAD|nr:acyl-CoA dehydrogenase [Phreatobacter sp. AB_2022a]MCZ0736406.1 acyl-CoA dehydrogenase [Phreatobacter sp. AB_2022a]
MDGRADHSSEPRAIARVIARDFARTAAAHDAAASFPLANIEALRRAGLAGLVTARAHGGGEAGLAEAVAVVAAIAEGEPSTALVLAQQYHFHAQLRQNPRWPEAMRARVARSAVTEGAFANNLRVEPALGTPMRGGLPATTARRVAGGWSISGHKIFSTGVPILAWNAVWARTDEPEPRVGAFLVPRGTPGFSIVETWDHLGMRASGSHDVLLQDVVIPADHAVDIRRPAEWGVPDAASAAWPVLLFAAVYDGVARAARNWLIGFLKNRTPANLGAPLSSLPRMQEAVGEIEALLLANTMLFGLAERVDQGTPPPVHESYLAKHLISANAIAAVEKAVALTGNPGLSRANPLERHLRDVLCARVHSPQSDTILLGAGRAALGLQS